MPYTVPMKKQKYFFARVLADTNIYKVEMGVQPFRYGAEVVISTEFGEDLAFVTSFLFEQELGPNQQPKSKVCPARFVRYASEEDKSLAQERMSRSRDLRREVVGMVKQLKLGMNVTHVLLPLKGNSIGIFYSAQGRVDFRELLKLLKGRLKEKVVLRQIGAKARLESFALDARIPMNKHHFSS